MPLNAILFDFGGVLMRTVDPVPRRELERRFGLERESVENLVFGNERWDQAQLGHISSAEFWGGIAQRLGLSAGELAEFRQAFWAGDRLDDELLGIVRYMHQSGIRTGLLSNGPADFGLHVEHLVAGTFDAVVISGREGIMKPDPAAYRLALERLGTRAEETVFVDDTARNVAAAERLGLRALRFTGVAALREALSELGLPLPPLTLAPVPAVEAVIFDWGGVMERGPDEAHVARWARRLDIPPETLVDALWGKECRLMEVGAMSEQEFNQHVAERLRLVDAEAARRFLDEFFTTDSLYGEVVEAVRALRGRYRVGLLSNAFPDLEEWVRRMYGLDVHAEFDTVVNSSRVGLRKPDPAVYRLALERLGAAPERTIYLDDSQRNVDSARCIGIHALQFVHPKATLPQLELLLGHSVTPPCGGTS
jgi:epoxide hydrolase-like predicted phosphatase